MISGYFSASFFACQTSHLVLCQTARRPEAHRTHLLALFGIQRRKPQLLAAPPLERDASSVLTLPSPLCSKAAHRQGKPPMPEIYTQKSHQLQLRSRGFPCVSQMLCKWVAGCSAVRLPTRCRLSLLVVMFPRMLIQLQCDPEAELNKLTKPVSGPTTVRWKWLPRC